jgi:hypothetical protein
MTEEFSLAAQNYRDQESYAATWLRERLISGPVKRKDLWLDLILAHLSEPQLYRAARRIGVVKTKCGFSAQTWIWSLPEHASEAESLASEEEGAKDTRATARKLNRRRRKKSRREEERA